MYKISAAYLEAFSNVINTKVLWSWNLASWTCYILNRAPHVKYSYCEKKIECICFRCCIWSII